MLSSISDEVLVIVAGKLLCGDITGRVNLVNVIRVDLGPVEACRYLSRAELVCNAWLMIRGFSVGLSDMIFTYTVPSVNEDDYAFRSVLSVRSAKQLDIIENQIKQYLNRIRCFDLEDKLPRNHTIWAMVETRLVSFVNSMMMGFLGQILINGERIPFGFRNRTLPHFSRYDYGAKSRGFVYHSFLAGLDPQEFFFHAMAERETLINTAFHPSKTSYFIRRFVRMMEDVAIRYDGTVRDGHNNIVQFLYNEDGLDPAKVEHERVDIVTMSDAAFDVVFLWTDADINSHDFGHDFMDDDAILDCKGNVTVRMALKLEYDMLMQDRRELRKSSPNHVPAVFSIRIERLIAGCKARFGIHARTKSDLRIPYVVDKVQALCAAIRDMASRQPRSLECGQRATSLFTIFIRSSLSAKQVITQHRLTRVCRPVPWILSWL
jgi:DNA-directed RNA polymerase II subunit RPB1